MMDVETKNSSPAKRYFFKKLKPTILCAYPGQIFSKKPFGF
ncbi:hypothetical protein B4065_0700 [Caldibacillus thermoamylovorans]|nr:hypothetical protein B4065_0700 [Caldibacillus thermoamylovorans]